MASFYDDASLVVIPSGYKTSKIYAEKPTDGSGDLTFTRASSATRVGANGLIEEVRTNVLTFSQDFSNASWIVDPLLTRTLNQTDPNGGTTAALYTATAGSNLTFGKNVTLVANAPNTVSIWIKGNASGSVSLRIDDSTLGTQTNINYTTSWQRFSVTRTVNQTNCQFVVGGFSTWGTGENLYFAFAQAEAGDIATNYIPTTTAAVSVGPVSNVPRLDYLGSSCPRLLLEPQRTNLVTFSEQFNDASWSKNAVSVTANNAASPDGYTNADLVTADGTNAIHDVFKTFSGATSNSVSVFVKAGTGRYINLVTNYESTGTDWVSVVFDLQTQTSTVANEGNLSSSSVKIEAYGNGWYRLTSSTTAASAVTLYNFIGIVASANPTRNSGSRGRVIATSSGTFWFYGAQAEAGAYATSYIPTLGASVTRVADAASKTGISSLIGQTEGTVFYQFSVPVNENITRAIVVSGATTDNRVAVSVFATSLFARVDVGAVNQVNSSATIVPTNMNKVAFRYKANDFAVYVNGVKVITDTSGSTFTAGTLDRFAFIQPDATSAFNGQVSQALLFTTALTDAQLAELTTL